MDCILCKRSTWIGLSGILTAGRYWFKNVEVDSFICMLVAIVNFIATIVSDK